MAEFVDIRMPEDQEEGVEAVVGRWLKQAGETVAEYEPLLEINTDKVVVEIPSPAAGTLAERTLEADAEVQPGQLLGRIAVDGGGPPAPTQVDSAPLETLPRPEMTARRLSPAVRRALKEHGLSPDSITGSGRGGRITYQDVVGHVESASTPSPPEPTDGFERRPHTPMRRSIARHMLQSVQTAPHVTAVFEADFSTVAADREACKAEFEQRGVKLTYTAYLVAAAAQALQAVPEVNSQWEDDALRLFADCHIGVAVALEQGGLVVPVIRDAQKLSLFEIASRLQELTGRARQGKLESADLEGGTFTITNHGVSGSLIATPIIHQPQSAILGVGKLEKRLRVEEGPGGDSIVIRPVAYVTLTIDHRALDGFTANLFLQHFTQGLEEWAE